MTSFVMLTFTEKAEINLVFHHRKPRESIVSAQSKVMKRVHFKRNGWETILRGTRAQSGMTSAQLSSPSQALPSTGFHLWPLAVSLSVEGNQFALWRVIAQCGIFGVRQCLWTQTTARRQGVRSLSFVGTHHYWATCSL